MFKGFSALFFVLLASTILLANVVIPHHHHETEICVISSHCKESCETGDHDTDDHNHNGENSIDHCILNPVFLVSVNQVKHEIKSFVFPFNQNDHNQFMGSFSGRNLLCLFPNYLFNTDPPFIFPAYIEYASCCLGLRAPPLFDVVTA